MGLTRAESTALGLGHLYPTRSDADMLRRLGVEPVVPSAPKEPGDGMNKTERAFYDMVMISSEVFRVLREPLKFRLAGRTWYTPDFAVWPRFPCVEHDVRLTFVEVKGFMRDDASVKLKLAADLFSCWRWLLVRRAGRHEWSVREVGRTGIGTHDIVVPWIG